MSSKSTDNDPTIGAGLLCTGVVCIVVYQNSAIIHFVLEVLFKAAMMIVAGILIQAALSLILYAVTTWTYRKIRQFLAWTRWITKSIQDLQKQVQAHKEQLSSIDSRQSGMHERLRGCEGGYWNHEERIKKLEPQDPEVEKKKIDKAVSELLGVKNV